MAKKKLQAGYVTLEKDGVTYTLRDEIQISAFENAGWEITEDNREGAGDDEAGNQDTGDTKTED
ncbi:hypothetical protein NHG32_06925 [Aerococcaceae bacterium NML191219]|nr:hypothetical protein [Aerococcaceae bacterium NML191219]